MSFRGLDSGSGDRFIFSSGSSVVDGNYGNNSMEMMPQLWFIFHRFPFSRYAVSWAGSTILKGSPRTEKTPCSRVSVRLYRILEANLVPERDRAIQDACEFASAAIHETSRQPFSGAASRDAAIRAWNSPTCDSQLSPIRQARRSQSSGRGHHREITPPPRAIQRNICGTVLLVASFLLQYFRCVSGT